jgi:ABC-type multidrug transport system fused ATPase/permease subunit
MPLRSRSVLQNARLIFGPKVVRWMAIGTLSSLMLAGVEIAIAYLIQLFLKSMHLLQQEVLVPAFLRDNIKTPTTFAVALLSVALIRAGCQYLSSQAGVISMEMSNARLRRIAIFDMLLRQPRKFVPASQVNTRLGEHFVKASLFGYAAAATIVAAVQCAGLALVMLTRAPRETAIALSGLFVFGLLVRSLQRRSHQKAGLIPRELELLTQGIERVARNTLLVRVLRTEAEEHGRFAGSIDRYAKHSLDSARLGVIASSTTPFVGVLLIVVIIGASTSLFGTSGLLLLSFLYMFMRFVQSLTTVVFNSSACVQNGPQFLASVAYVDGFSVEEVERATQMTANPEPRSGIVADAEPPAIAFEGVSFSYDRKNPVLSNLSLVVPGGAQLAIVGASGTGKSTLLALLLGIEAPTSGSIRLGGVEPRAYYTDGVGRVGYVGAEAFLVAGTVRDNMMYGAHKKSTDEELFQALALAKLDGTIRDLPDGLEHVIGEDGSGLSAGQKQRLCLARALLAKPALLVLDEASANLDEATELEIAETLSALRGVCTCILVSHRPGILRYTSHRLQLGASAANERTSESNGLALERVGGEPRQPVTATSG